MIFLKILTQSRFDMQNKVFAFLDHTEEMIFFQIRDGNIRFWVTAYTSKNWKSYKVYQEWTIVKAIHS